MYWISDSKYITHIVHIMHSKPKQKEREKKQNIIFSNSVRLLSTYRIHSKQKNTIPQKARAFPVHD